MKKEIIILTVEDVINKINDHAEHLHYNKMDAYIEETNQEELDAGILPDFFTDPDFVKLYNAQTDVITDDCILHFITYKEGNKVYCVFDERQFDEMDEFFENVMDKTEEILNWFFNRGEREFTSNKWDVWHNNVYEGVAYRGGSGYVYNIACKKSCERII